MPAWLEAPLQLYVSTAGEVGAVACVAAAAVPSSQPAHAQKATLGAPPLPPLPAATSALSSTWIRRVTSQGLRPPSPLALPSPRHHARRAKRASRP